MNKTVSWVAPDIHEWNGQKGTVYYVNVKFEDGDTASIGSKDRATAQERRALLEAITGTEMFFELESKSEGKWKIKDWRAPGFAPSAAPAAASGHAKHSRDEGMAWGNALNVAAQALQHDLRVDDLLSVAHRIYAARPDTSAPAPPPSPSAAVPAVAGADPRPGAASLAGTPATAAAPDPTSVPDGEAGADPQEEGDPADGVDTPSSCDHEWTSLRPDGEPFKGGIQRCLTCGATRRRTE